MSAIDTQQHVLAMSKYFTFVTLNLQTFKTGIALLECISPRGFHGIVPLEFPYLQATGSARVNRILWQ